MVLTVEQKTFLANYINDIEAIVESDDVNELLLMIDDAIVDTFDSNGKPDDTGIKLQRIYDEIYSSN